MEHVFPGKLCELSHTSFLNVACSQWLQLHHFHLPKKRHAVRRGFDNNNGHGIPCSCGSRSVCGAAYKDFSQKKCTHILAEHSCNDETCIKFGALEAFNHLVRLLQDAMQRYAIQLDTCFVMLCYLS